MHAPESDPSRPANRLRFSLFALFLLMTTVCLLLAWWAQPRQCTVVSLFKVDATPVALIGGSAEIDAEEYRVFQQNQLEILKSPLVIQAAIRDPAIAALPAIATRDDPVQWIIQNLEAEILPNSEILSLRMHGPEAMSDDLRRIVDAVSRAYLNEVVFEEDRRKGVHRDALAKSLLKIQEQLKRKHEILNELKNESVAENEIEIEMKTMEVDVLKNLSRQMYLGLEILDVDRRALPRIRQLQPATVAFE
jgi:hypothetical protein